MDYEGFLKLLDYWNSKKIRGHKANLQGITPAINKALEQHTLEQLKTATDRYAIMFHDSTYLYCKYKWSLPRFLYNNSFVAFLDNGHKWINYCKFKKWQANNPGEIKDVQLDLKTMNYLKYRDSEHWKQFCKFALEHYGHACQMCGASNTKLDVHHKTYESRGEETIDDVLVLCRKCHIQYHHNKGDYTTLSHTVISPHS